MSKTYANKGAFPFILILTTLFYVAQLSALTITPNDMTDGQIPDAQENIIINVSNGNYQRYLKMPENPRNGTYVHFKSNAEMSFQLYGDSFPYNGVEVKSNTEQRFFWWDQYKVWYPAWNWFYNDKLDYFGDDSEGTRMFDIHRNTRGNYKNYRSIAVFFREGGHGTGVRLPADNNIEGDRLTLHNLSTNRNDWVKVVSALPDSKFPKHHSVKPTEINSYVWTNNDWRPLDVPNHKLCIQDIWQGHMEQIPGWPTGLMGEQYAPVTEVYTEDGCWLANLQLPQSGDSELGNIILLRHSSSSLVTVKSNGTNLKRDYSIPKFTKLWFKYDGKAWNKIKEVTYPKSVYGNEEVESKWEMMN